MPPSSSSRADLSRGHLGLRPDQVSANGWLPIMRHHSLFMAHDHVAIVIHTPEVHPHHPAIRPRHQGELGPWRHACAPAPEELIGEPDAAKVDRNRPDRREASGWCVCAPAIRSRRDQRSCCRARRWMWAPRSTRDTSSSPHRRCSSPWDTQVRAAGARPRVVGGTRRRDVPRQTISSRRLHSQRVQHGLQCREIAS